MKHGWIRECRIVGIVVPETEGGQIVRVGRIRERTGKREPRDIQRDADPRVSIESCHPPPLACRRHGRLKRRVSVNSQNLNRRKNRRQYSIRSRTPASDAA